MVVVLVVLIFMSGLKINNIKFENIRLQANYSQPKFEGGPNIDFTRIIVVI